MKRDPHREAWTAFVEGRKPVIRKYRNEPQGKYASKREARVAHDLAALAERGVITDLKEQVPFVLIPADGKLRAIRYIADFTYYDEDGLHVIDVKGGKATKTGVYRLKRRLMRYVHGIDIWEL